MYVYVPSDIHCLSSTKRRLSISYLLKFDLRICKTSPLESARFRMRISSINQLNAWAFHHNPLFPILSVVGDAKFGILTLLVDHFNIQFTYISITLLALYT